jgi:hypothetical protein
MKSPTVAEKIELKRRNSWTVSGDIETDDVSPKAAAVDFFNHFVIISASVLLFRFAASLTYVLHETFHASAPNPCWWYYYSPLLLLVYIILISPKVSCSILNLLMAAIHFAMNFAIYLSKISAHQSWNVHEFIVAMEISIVVYILVLESKQRFGSWVYIACYSKSNAAILINRIKYWYIGLYIFLLYSALTKTFQKRLRYNRHTI